jgi:hypothetical protein
MGAVLEGLRNAKKPITRVFNQEIIIGYVDSGNKLHFFNNTEAQTKRLPSYLDKLEVS